jgi:hypothetical protein
MIKFLHYLYLLDQLFDHIILIYNRFEDFFQSIYRFRILLSIYIYKLQACKHFSIFTITYPFSQLKIVHS